MERFTHDLLPLGQGVLHAALKSVLSTWLLRMAVLAFPRPSFFVVAVALTDIAIAITRTSLGMLTSKEPISFSISCLLATVQLFTSVHALLYLDSTALVMLEVVSTIFIVVPCSLYRNMYPRRTPLLLLSFALMATGSFLYLHHMWQPTVWSPMSTRFALAFVVRAAVAAWEAWRPSASLSAMERRLFGGGLALLAALLMRGGALRSDLSSLRTKHGTAVQALVTGALGVRWLAGSGVLAGASQLPALWETLLQHACLLLVALAGGAGAHGAAAWVTLAVAASFLYQYELDRIESDLLAQCG